MMTDAPSFRDPAFLSEHIRHTMAFYHPRCIDPRARRLFPFLQGRRHHLRCRHAAPGQQHPLHLQLRDGVPPLRRSADYQAAVAARPRVPARRPPQPGHRRLRLAARCRQRGPGRHQPLLRPGLRACWPTPRRWRPASPKRSDHLDETWELMERRFWSEADGLYRDEISAGWHDVSPYRGQNANMHSCEAMLAAFEASGETRYLDRAETLAAASRVDLAAQGRRAGLGALRPELAGRLGLQSRRSQAPLPPVGFPARPPDRMGEAAADPGPAPAGRLAGADARSDCSTPRWRGPGTTSHGGICYGFAPDGSICDGDKYFWVQAESFAAAALLAKRTGEQRYWVWYDRIWDYSLGAHRSITSMGLVSDPRPAKPQIRRQEEPGRQDRLPHDGRLLRSAQRSDEIDEGFVP